MNKLLLILLFNTNILFGASTEDQNFKYNPEINCHRTEHFQKLEAPIKEPYSEPYKKYVQNSKVKIIEALGIYLPKDLLEIINQYKCSYARWLINSKELINATSRGQIVNVKELLESEEVDVDGKKVWMTSLMVAVNYHRSKEIIELLLQHGASVNTKKFSIDWTELMCAIQNNKKEIVELLLQHGANVNTIIGDFHIGEYNSTNGTALMYACQIGNEKIIDLLINAGADIFATDSKGNNILDYANIGRSLHIYKKIELLLKQYTKSQSKGCNIQ